ncbi:hypothetical protein O0I10_009941 [Lichtheimia ornata]|uniref:Transmembrane protein n=1 Tax=Lichtheimia ornata TaxID=688661 RepID=A0AAD7UWG9_9FUNG|nr:uncharacterized protein O0I10_009941 [Lichtheimia ornata]KAJ8654373.1 hypothetical protein O0I10_009941 [Lichtheimia ornata]
MSDPSSSPAPQGPDGLEIMSESISLACISIMAVALGSKTKTEHFNTITYGRILVLALYLFSWTFSAISIVVVSTNNNNIVSCTLGIIICVIFYAATKIVMYSWLIERVHLVSDVRGSRFSSWQYRFHLCLLCPYIGIFVLMVTFRNNLILEDGTCIIGLQSISSIPLMLLNLYLTFLFVKPLITSGIGHHGGHHNWRSTRLYKLTRRTVVASVVCLFVSLANILTLAIAQGHERGLMCLSMCTADVTINVITVHWVTSPHIKMSVRNATTLGSNNNDYNSSSSQQQSPTTVAAAAAGVNGSLYQVNKHLYDTMLEPSTHHHQDPMTDTESMHSIQVSQTSSVKPLQQDAA